MDNKKITIELRKLAKTCKHSEVADLQALVMHLRELEVFNAREVKLLVDAAKAEVLEDLCAPGGAGVLSLSRDRLSSRLMSETDATNDEAHWAVETWANALSGKVTEITHARPPQKSLSWD
jgi:hypothetical protein